MADVNSSNVRSDRRKTSGETAKSQGHRNPCPAMLPVCTALQRQRQLLPLPSAQDLRLLSAQLCAALEILGQPLRQKRKVFKPRLHILEEEALSAWKCPNCRSDRSDFSALNPSSLDTPEAKGHSC
ncbi:hypothetical protein LEMLEM_LOCUS12527 [Lemmus lemmus]